MIREAGPDDVADLRTMMAGSNGYADPAARAMIVSYARAWTLPASAEDGHVRLLQDGDGIAGFYHLVPHAEGLELNLFFTADALQGRGVGRLLFEDMAATARGLGAPQVAIVSNPAAADFYRRMGARDAGVVAPSATIGWERPRLVLDL